MQHINTAGLDLIKNFEGFRAQAYLDPAGIWTFGFGETQRPGGGPVQSGDSISEEAALALLKLRLERDFEPAVHELVKVCLTNNEFSSLVSFIYNLGPGALAESTLLKKLNAGDLHGAAAEFIRWNKAQVQGQLQELPGLTRRRAAERDLFMAWDPSQLPSSREAGKAPAGLSSLGAAKAPSVDSEGPVEGQARAWRLFSPGSDSSASKDIPEPAEEFIEVLRWGAERLGLAFGVNTERRKVFLGKAPVAGPAADPPKQTPGNKAAPALVGVSVAKRMKAGDIHILCDLRHRTAAAFDDKGEKLWRVDVRGEGVLGTFPESEPTWDSPKSDCPPGLWKAVAVEAIPAGDPEINAYGRFFIWLQPLEGPCSKVNRSGIGGHGGGSAAPDPLAAHQGWYETLGCNRFQNQDLEEKVAPAVQKALASGHDVWWSTTWQK